MNPEEIRNHCIRNDIHEVCFFCKKDCKEPYRFWSGCMPPEFFCEDYEYKEVE